MASYRLLCDAKIFLVALSLLDNLFCIYSPNFFILDEPTNHLDVETVEALGKALTQFNVSLFKNFPLEKRKLPYAIRH